MNLTGELGDLAGEYIAALEQLQALYRGAEDEIGYSPGTSETGPISGTIGGEDYETRVERQLGDDGAIRDKDVRLYRRDIGKEIEFLRRRRDFLFPLVGWRAPRLDEEIRRGYRDSDGRLRVVGAE